MARAITFDVEIKDKDNLIDKLSDLVNELNELTELIGEWNNIEAKEHCAKIEEILSDFLEIKRIG